MNPLYEPFPSTVTVKGKRYGIITDFKEWVKFADMVQDETLEAKNKFVYAMQYYIDLPQDTTEEVINALIDFFIMKEVYPDRVSEDTQGAPYVHRKPLFDFGYDAGCIIAGFQQAYGMDLTAVNMHWWHFRILLDSLPENTEFKQRIYYRGINVGEIRDVKEKQRILKLQRQIALSVPPPSDEEIGDIFW